MATQGIICQGCGVEAPAKYVEFHQNVGALVIRFTSAVKGNLCKRCVHAEFWKRTMITLGVGWVGTISLIIAPIFVIMNVVRYLTALGMPGVPAGAVPPVLNPQAIHNLEPFAAEIMNRLNGGEQLIPVAQDISSRAGVTPGQVVLYIVALAEASRQPAVQKTFGFPVLPVGGGPPPLPVRSIPVAPVPPMT